MLLLRSIFFTILQPGTAVVLIPYWLISSGSAGILSSHQPRRYLGAPLIVTGSAGLLWCIREFFSRRRGTISPIDSPKSLVVRGLYKYVRNPMYVSVVTILIGEATFFMSLPVLIEAGVFIILAHIFVAGYEEPSLRRGFGESYERYTQAVGRWIPRYRSSAT
ncbi:MAG: methyltransferase family protein [Pyrinomonadaceae bacterium]